MVVGVPGEENLEILEALRRSSIRFVPTRHEGTAAFMANAHGRLTGRAGVALATLGPGATNLLTGVADATMDLAPMVAVTGQARLAKQPHHSMDVPRLFQPVTRLATRVVDAAVLPEVVRRAFQSAEAEQPGASLIELPEDVAASSTGARPIVPVPFRRPGPDPRSIAEAVAVLRTAERPVILAGNGVIRAGASPALTRLAERIPAPVVATFMGKGALSEDHALAVAPLGDRQEALEETCLDVADVVLAIGYDLAEYPPDAWNASPSDRRIIHVSPYENPIDAHYQPTVLVLGHMGTVLDALYAELPTRRTSIVEDALRIHQRRVAHFRAYGELAAFPMRPGRVLHDLRLALAPDDIVVSDAGLHKLWIANRFPALAPNTVLISNGYAARGFGLATAMMAACLYPSRQVVAVMGDGGLVMALGDLETARRLGVHLTVVVLVDDGCGLVRQHQNERCGYPLGGGLRQS